MEVVAPAALQQRITPAALAAGAVAGCVLVAAVDPNEGGPYPLCPTRALLDVDCPACGTLRGVHALLHGRIGTALDHNLLLALAVPIGVLLWVRLVLAAIGRRPGPLRVPAWVPVAAFVVGGAFMLLRNLPVDSLDWLRSSA